MTDVEEEISASPRPSPLVWARCSAFQLGLVFSLFLFVLARYSAFVSFVLGSVFSLHLICNGLGVKPS